MMSKSDKTLGDLHEAKYPLLHPAKSIRNQQVWNEGKQVGAIEYEVNTEKEAAERVYDSVSAATPRAASVLIIDDTIGSGGTMLEMGRALRAGGATDVFGLSVAKDAKFTRGGIDLSRGCWQ